jgi:uncharacterized protein YrrD
MGDQEKQIAWTALQSGTPVLAKDGSEVGKVSKVVGDVGKDIFSGILFRQGFFDSEHFVPADLIEDITPQHVRARLSVQEAKELGPHDA